MGKIPGWYRGLRGDGPLVPIGLAIGGTLALALAIAAAVTVIGLNLLHFRGFKPEPLLSAGTLYDLLKVAFAVSAGIGGVIALVTAYRRQRFTELAHDLAARSELREASRLFSERFATAAGQLGDDRPAAVRLAGVYAMAGLADDWPAQRQTCVDVLCAYLRMPYEPDPGGEAPAGARQAFRALREVRHTVIRVITAHLQADDRRAATAQDWRGLRLDFTDAVFDGGTFAGAEFCGGLVSFTGAEFCGGTVDFGRARFSGGAVRFDLAKFSGGTVRFDRAEFSGGAVSFIHAEFSGAAVSFDRAEFSGGAVSFIYAEFSGGAVSFDRAEFSDCTVSFDLAKFSSGAVGFTGAKFSGGEVRFDLAKFSGGTVSFILAKFSGGEVNFGRAQISGGDVSFYRAQFSGGTVSFSRTKFSGGIADFGDAKFIGGTVDFGRAADWSVPPHLPPWGEPPPPGVTLPKEQD